MCFTWCYMYHDWQSLLVLIWLLHSTLFRSTTLFVKVTAYFYLPMFMLIVLQYYVANIYGMVDWAYIE